MAVNEYNSRTALLIGEDAIDILSRSHVMVVGVGGVGAYSVEILARAGIGQLTIIDGDTVSPSNLNRQLPALVSTLGLPKVEVMKNRILDIAPECRVDARMEFLDAECIGTLLAELKPDFVVDAIDSVKPKVELITQCLHNKVKLISSMGAGGRIDPSKVQYADISDTYNDGLARAVRQRLKDGGISRGVKVVFSPETPRKDALLLTDELPFKVSSYGTAPWLPAQFGIMLGAYVVNKLTRQHL
ncbi:MAG: tRNA threonylcarbamoyladenosine dehydratase [Muribaculum sp.]|nr:tRNA threonylcarbamoyladenosine dehydratase [Muribaculum sp.]